MQEKTRINKYLSQSGVASRREVDKLIEEGKIKVNGLKAEPGMKVCDSDKIIVDGKQVGEKEKNVYFLLNKPSGIISASKDKREKTVVELINCKERIYPVGRLDMDTEGLLILSNDGDMFNKIIHPKSQVYKKYYTRVKGNITDEAIRRLAAGVVLEDGLTLPAKVKLISRSKVESEIEISIREGRNRQIRRMCKEVGFSVRYLKRLELGGLGLGSLKSGEYRELTIEEIEYLKNL